VCGAHRFHRRSWPSLPGIALTACVSAAFSPAEYAENIGDGKNQEFRESEQKRIMDLLENF